MIGITSVPNLNATFGAVEYSSILTQLHSKRKEQVKLNNRYV